MLATGAGISVAVMGSWVTSLSLLTHGVYFMYLKGGHSNVKRLTPNACSV